MSKRYDNPKDLIFWNRPFLSIGGMWPLQSRALIFYPWLVYSLVHLCLGLADLVEVLGDLESVIANLGETAFLIMIISKMLVLRYSRILRKSMRQVASSGHEVYYRNEEERRIYMSYTNRGVRFFTILLWITSITAIVYYFKSLRINFGTELLDGFIEYPLPYRLRLFFNITDIRTYFLVYAYQGPMIYIYTCHAILACFVWSLVIDVCGQLSVLSFRIKNMKSNPSEPDNNLESAIRDIVQNHRQIIWSSKSIDGAFNIALLVELIVCTVIMGLCMYNVIMNSDFSDAAEFVSFFLYIFMLLLVTYGYCVAGDFLVRESLNVRDSYYECDWYNMPPSCKKMIIICMIRTCMPLQLTGGGFYIYTMESLTTVVKTAMTYGSMLRQLAPLID